MVMIMNESCLSISGTPKRKSFRTQKQKQKRNGADGGEGSAPPSYGKYSTRRTVTARGEERMIKAPSIITGDKKKRSREAYTRALRAPPPPSSSTSLHTTRRTAAGGGGCVSGNGSPTTDVRPHEDGDGAAVATVPAPALAAGASTWLASSSVMSSSRVTSTARPCSCSCSSCFCSGGHGTPGPGMSPRSHLARRSARPSIHGPALDSVQPPPPLPLPPLLQLSLSVSSPLSLLLSVVVASVASVQAQVQVPPSATGRFSGATRSRSVAY